MSEKNFGVSKGDRVKLLAMPNDINPVPSGTLGTVTGFHIDHTTDDGRFSQIWVKWDNGSVLNLLPHVDVWEVV